MDKVEELLTRGVDQILPTKAELEKVLRSGKKLTLYQGFDPTGMQLHLGHMVGLKKLAQFQKAGHHVIFLIGDGTGQAGDPSGKMKTRERFLSNEELKKNATDYVKQAGRIVNFSGDNPIEIRYNGDWLNKLTLAELLNIAGHFSVQQLIERDLFQKRLEAKESLNLREFLYPLLQGYDSVAMSVDLEIGGSDQTFNMLAGRQLVKEIQNREKFVLTTPLLADKVGNKIGKTTNNVIALTDTPTNLYGEIMSLSDDVIVKALEFLTDVPIKEVEEIEKSVASGNNPMQYKKKLAFEIVKQLNDENSAQKAQEDFENTFSKGQIPQDVPTIKIKEASVELVDFLVDNNLAPSKSEAKR
ncbi:MAG TPA: tyrosine--tRNA ligase, partial [Candidatus Saccharimonadales bacterium]|nr:tyrosine--tRNA ligase [Candidatus Saccharimonadales bacterium]